MLLELFAGRRSDGGDAHEQVRVEALGDGQFRLLQSPGLVLGVAADDVFELQPDGRFRIVSRGRNLCVQVFTRDRGDEVEPWATEHLAAVGARLDGRSASQLVYTVPVAVGFAAVERALASIVGRFPGVEWYYGNVYDPSDGVTPLRWWE